jgi:hypothetical protein
MGYEMPHFLGRLGALMFVLVAVAPISEAQARHWGHWKFFGYWGQGLQEGRHLRPSVEEDGTNVGRARGDVRAFALGPVFS